MPKAFPPRPGNKEESLTLTVAHLMTRSRFRSSAGNISSEHLNAPTVSLIVTDWLNKASLLLRPVVSPASPIPETRRPRLPPGLLL